MKSQIRECNNCHYTALILDIEYKQDEHCHHCKSGLMNIINKVKQ